MLVPLLYLSNNEAPTPKRFISERPDSYRPPRCRGVVGIWSASSDHPDAAEVSPCLPDWVAPTALHERCRSHKELCLEMLAVGHEVGHKDKHICAAAGGGLRDAG